MSNPGSSVELDTFPGEDGAEYFGRFYVCFGGLKQTWKSHCRPIFGLDGCFLKCTTKGQLLAAVGRDANNQMFPIAWAVVEVENEDNWMWFIEKLQKDLDLVNGGGFTVISDRQKGLINAVARLLPNAEHRMCARHIYANLKKKYPNRAEMKAKFWKVAKSYNKAQYARSLTKVLEYDMNVHNSILEKNPMNCSLAYFEPTSKCDDVSNNIFEAFNHAIDPARSMPLVEMLETIHKKAMLRIATRKAKAMNHRGKISIKAMEKVEEEKKKMKKSSIYPYGHDSWEVKETYTAYKVKMVERSCTCRKWEMSGLPCRHALKVIEEKKRRQEDYMDDCFLTSKWRVQYDGIVEGCAGTTFWEGDETVILPPPVQDEEENKRKKIQKRIRERNESPSKKRSKVATNEEPTKASREKRIVHCGKCGWEGHNTRKCHNMVLKMHREPRKKKKVAEDVGERSSQPMQSQVIDTSF